jgi:cytochrome P450
VEFDPFSDDFFGDPYPIYALLRRNQPVYYSEKHDFYALSRYQDVAAALKDWETFSSSRGVDLNTIKNGMKYQTGIIMLDPPEQSRLRVLVSRAFTPRAIAAKEPLVRETIEEYAAGLGTDFDGVADFAAPFPVEIISKLLGVPPENRQRIRTTLDFVLHRGEGINKLSDEQTAVAIEMFEYFFTLVAERRESRGTDMISDLVGAEVEREDGSTTTLDDIEVAAFVSLLGGAGAETVTKFVGNALVLFARHPRQWQMLRENRELVPSAVEEVLRYEPPASYIGRYTMREFSAHGRIIPAGSAVLLLVGAATRDDDAYPDPEKFDITREIRQNLAFGYGVHSCLGAALARMESQTALNVLLDRMPRFEVDESGLERVNMSNVLGYKNVPVRVPR